MADIVNVQTIQSTTYLTQVKSQFDRIDQAVESGRTVTLGLSENDRAISLSITRDNVTRTDVPSKEVAPRAHSLADNETLPAQIAQRYHFDLGELDRHVKPKDIEAERTQPSGRSANLATSHTAGLPPGLPNPAVHFILGNWVLAEDCVYTTNDAITLTAKRGFITDLASIPRIFWPLVASFELSLTAPLFHDLIYRAMGKIALPHGTVEPENKVFTRSEADEIFLELMTRAKLSFWRRNVAYLAVDFFGKSAWRKSAAG